MVASISPIVSANASTKYFAQDGYYMDGSEEQKATMSWHGKGIDELGLTAEAVTAEQFRLIMDGYVPGTDIRLGRIRDGKHQHKHGTDITFSAPKSVSLAAFIGGDERIIQAHREAVKSTLSYIEKNILVSRAVNERTGALERIRGQHMVAAIFQHETSRNLDPQLHTHSVIANMAMGEDGKWRTVENRTLYDNLMMIGAQYHNELASNLRELGYGIEKTGKNGLFNLTDASGKPLYNKEVLEAFSTRSEQIRNALKDLGKDADDLKLKDRAALLTRAAKENPNWDELRGIWKAQAMSLGVEMGNLTREKDAKNPADIRAGQPGISAIEAVEWATRHLEERESVFTKNDLVAAAITRDPGMIRAEGIEQAIAELKEQHHLVEAKKGWEAAFTTAKTINTERENIARLESMKGKSSEIISERKVERYLDNSNLTDGQKDAVRSIFGSQDRAIGVQGYAGSGKTTMLNAVREITEERAQEFLGKKTDIIGLAPSASAARTMERESGIASGTLQSFLAKHTAIIRDGGSPKDAAAMKGGVIIIDEASMISSQQMRDLLAITETLKPDRIVLIGDVKQLDAVNAGQPFHQLQRATEMETSVMDQIMRQRDDNLRAAVIESLSGQPAAALERLEKSIIEVSKSGLGVEAANNWLSLAPEVRENTGLMAPTHALREEINEVIRDDFAKNDILHGEAVNISQMSSLRMTEAEKEVASNYHEGQVILFENEVRSIGVEAGDMATVLGREDGSVIIRIDGKDDVYKIDPAGGIAPRLDIYETSDMELRAGDIIRWTRNDKELDLINTHQAEVISVGDGSIHIRNEDGRDMELPLDHTALRHSDYAFNATVHSMQGRTMDNVIAVLDSSHPELTNQKTFYVEISRARESATLITDDRNKLAETLELNTGERLTALAGIADEPIRGADIDERLRASLEEARIDSGLTFEEFEAMHADAPEPDYDGRDEDLEMDMGEFDAEPEFGEADHEIAEDREIKREKEKDFGLDL